MILLCILDCIVIITNMPAIKKTAKPERRPKGMTKLEKKLKYKETLAVAKAAYVPTGNPTGRQPKSNDPKHLAELAAARERRAQGLKVYVKLGAAGKPRGRKPKDAARTKAGAVSKAKK